MDAGFGDNVHVEAVAEVDRVDVVAFEVGVHDCEEDLQEEVDGIEEDGEQEQPVQRACISCVVERRLRSGYGDVCSAYHASPDILSWATAPCRGAADFSQRAEYDVSTLEV